MFLNGVFISFIVRLDLNLKFDIYRVIYYWYFVNECFKSEFKVIMSVV